MAEPEYDYFIEYEYVYDDNDMVVKDPFNVAAWASEKLFSFHIKLTERNLQACKRKVAQ